MSVLSRGLEPDLSDLVTEVLDRWPSAGLAVAVVRDGRLAWFRGDGVANASSRRPVTQDTVFRVGSVTKTFTAVAVLQLWERGLVDLDAPANDYLCSVRLNPKDGRYQPATVRHLLTHTAGIGYWLRLPDLLRPRVGSGVRAGRSVPSVSELYRRGLPVEVEPGSKWVYSNHGFAALGQLVEDLSGVPLDHYLRQHVFGPLGMEHTDLGRSARVRPYLATGYVLRSRGLRPVADRPVPALGAGEVYSTAADLTRYVTALLHGGAHGSGRVLEPTTTASMFRPHFRADPRLPGMGLGFLLGQEGDRRTVGHDGIVPGFLSEMLLAPDDGVGVVVLGNTGGLDGRGAPEPLGVALVRRLLGLPDEAVHCDVPAHPETWHELCGWYGPDPGPVTNLFTRAFLGAGAEVTVRDGQLMLKPLTPVPAVRRGMRLHPDDPHDPRVFRVDLAGLGKGTQRVVFGGGPGTGTPMRLLMDAMALRKRPDVGNPRPWTVGVLAAGGVAVAARGVARRAAPRRP